MIRRNVTPLQPRLDLTLEIAGRPWAPPVAVHSRLRHRRDPLPIGARVVERNGREAAVLATLSAIRLAAVVAAPIGSLVARVFPATIDRRGYARKNLRLT